MTTLDSRTARIPDNRWGARRTTSVLLSGALIASAMAAMAVPSLARDANCTRVRMTDSDGHTTTVTRSGVGIVAWRTDMNITAYDRCSHGDLYNLVTVYDANIRQKGGAAVVSAVQYRRTGSTTWYSMLRRPGDYVRASDRYSQGWYVGGHLDLTSTWRVTYVRLYTYVLFGGVPFGGRYHTCNMVYGNCT